MLTSIQLTNFKSYRQAKLTLAPLTFLIGPNASGKSNAIEGIRLLNWLAKGKRLDDIERDIQGGDAVVRGQARDLFRDATAPFQLEAHLADAPQGWCDFSISIGQLNDQLVVTGEQITNPEQKVPLYRVDNEPNAHSDEISVAYNNFRRGRTKPHIPCSNRQAVFYQLETPGRFQQAHSEAQQWIPAVSRVLRETLRAIVFLDPRPAQMRDYEYAGDRQLKEDGSNLSAVLYQLCQQKDSKQALLDFIRSLPEQDITDIRFIETQRQDVMVQLEETFGEKSRLVDAPLLSDGTLRVLAVGAALLSAPEGALLIIEEVDNGVHPSRADLLVRQIRDLASQRRLRVLMTSHNPALLDALPDAGLADVLCCYRDPQLGDSRLIRLADLERYSELVAQGPLGQLMTRRVLERFLKDETSPAQRREAALSWLDALTQDTASAK
ncbi:AAA family ATPase [Thiohalocapsa marina]|uniref:AAA family ATPase n=1 Tax=Thiohalocapsa marina TaxID=424902 RepID=A0A5M8FLD1_9GAMM|nr:AAA family ATPase [Thiohalocapsa marina]KAA6183921.1 AAA family ATPase [Thiohalocapsa marina]